MNRNATAASPWSANAFKVFSGIVSMVAGAARALTYSVSGAAGGQFLPAGGGQRWRYVHRDPTIGLVGGVEYRPEQVGRTAQVFQRQLGEQRFSRKARQRLGVDGRVVGSAAADGGIEDAGIGGEPGNRILGDVARQGAVVEKGAGNVVQPQALAEIVQLPVRFQVGSNLASLGLVAAG
jgi:hypothetical protein